MDTSTTATRASLIRQYAEGPALLRDALARVPKEALQWRPAAGKWSAHEVVCHCADSETMAAMRIRQLVGIDRPTILGYDQDRFARDFDYHSLSLDTAMAQVVSVRAWTADLIRRLPESAWAREGVHTESGRYTADKWLGIYADHLDAHARQLDRNVAAWNERKRSAKP